jgi:mono/diheme cytochrome c family protein
MVADVYHGLAGVPRGAVKWLRVLEQVPRPWAAQYKGNSDEYDQQHIVISKDTHLGLKVQHGVVPVEADGSAHFVVPADANIFLQALDADCLAVQTERTFVNYRPGEVRACIGCHETPESAMGQGGAERENRLAFGRAPSRPGPQPGEARGQRPLHYPADVQPLFDRHCVACHGNGEKVAGTLDLRGTPTQKFSVSYESLVPERRKGKGNSDRGLLGWVIGENHPKTGNVEYLPALSLGAHTSVLAAMLSRGRIRLADAVRQARAEKLAKGHADVVAKLNDAETLPLMNWIDTNCQYYGSYWGRRDLRHQGMPSFRRVPTFEEARGKRAPEWVARSE